MPVNLINQSVISAYVWEWLEWSKFWQAQQFRNYFFRSKFSFCFFFLTTIESTSFYRSHHQCSASKGRHFWFFNKEKINFVSHSWVTVMGNPSKQKNPEDHATLNDLVKVWCNTGLTGTYMYWLTDYLSSSWVSDWCNTGLTVMW